MENVQLLVNSTVVDIGFDNTTVTLATGEIISGHVILGADGVKSPVRGKLLSDATDRAMPVGDAIYRVILSRELMINDPELRHLIEEPKAVRWVGPDRHVIAYPVRNHELYNVVLTHPDRGGIEESWTTSGSKQSMIEEYEGWDPRLKKNNAPGGRRGGP
jgi:salicylate hydroxylase